MKKLLILSAIVLTGAVAANAQQAAVSVTVGDIRTIAVTGNPAFSLSSTADYNAVAGSTGQEGSTTSSLTVVSRNGFKVKAALSGDLHNSASSPNGLVDIPGSKLAIKVATTTNGSTQVPTIKNTYTNFGDGGSTIADIAKTTSTSNDAGTLGSVFDVTYKLGDFPNVINLSTGSFSANVVYTIEAN